MILEAWNTFSSTKITKKSKHRFQISIGKNKSNGKSRRKKGKDSIPQRNSDFPIQKD